LAGRCHVHTGLWRCTGTGRKRGKRKVGGSSLFLLVEQIQQKLLLLVLLDLELALVCLLQDVEQHRRERRGGCGSAAGFLGEIIGDVVVGRRWLGDGGR
jgi:hypothetical protein